MSELAIEGGSPVRTQPLPPWPSFTDDEAEQVALLLEGARRGSVNSNSEYFHRLITRAAAELPGAALVALLRQQATHEPLRSETWWLDQVNLHGPFRALRELVQRAPLCAAAPQRV